MGNFLPDICVCNEREGKDIAKTSIKATISDKNIKIIDYIGILASSYTINEAIKPLHNFIPIELKCIKDIETSITHSHVKLKCVNDNNSRIIIKIVYSNPGKFFLYICPMWMEEEKGILEYVYQKKTLNEVRVN